MAEIQTWYLRHVFNPELFQQAVDRSIAAAEALKKETDFDTIAFSGMSGAAMAFILSHWMNVPLLCVRKRNEQSHYVQQSGKILEGNVKNARRYLIVDDFISSGATVNHIVESIQVSNLTAKCVGMLMYASYRDDDFKHASWDYSVKVISARPED